MNMPEVADIEQLPVSQARTGESEAWDALFRRYQLPLYVYAFELTRHEQASLDVVQETFIAAVRHIGGLREDGKQHSGTGSPEDRGQVACAAVRTPIKCL